MTDPNKKIQVVDVLALRFFLVIFIARLLHLFLGMQVASVVVPPFMAIHFINAYAEVDEDGEATEIIADCCERYGDPAIIKTLILRQLRSFRGMDLLPNSRVGRFRIPLDGSTFGELQ